MKKIIFIFTFLLISNYFCTALYQNLINTSLNKLEYSINFVKLSTLIKQDYNSNLNNSKLEEVLKYNYELCTKYKQDFALNLSKIAIESAFKSDAVSSSNCVGLHQISKILCDDYKVSFYEIKKDPLKNSEVGIRYFAEIMNKNNNDINRSLKCYNLGEYAPEYKFSKNTYDKAVLNKYNYFKQLIEKSTIN